MAVEATTNDPVYLVMRSGINVSADTTVLNTELKKAAKKLREFLNLPKPVKKQKIDKPVDFNKFLRQLCKRRK